MAQERTEQIINYLKLHSLVTVDDLVKVCGASPATVRRELVHLDKEGLIYRVHGGVTLNRFTPQPTTSEKQGKHHEEKLNIADAAAKLIKPNDSIVLDAGTTTLEIARKIISLPLRVITPDLHIGLLLAEYQQIEVSLTGGNVDWSSQSCIGPKATSWLEQIHPSYTFLSCNAFDIKTGITAPTYEKAFIKQTLLHQSSKCVLVTDSSKYGQTQLFEVGKLQELDTIITDSKLNEKEAEKIESLGIKLVLC